MKQTKLDIAPPLIERKCQWGTCEGDFAYCINGVDLCFWHGKEQLDVLVARVHGRELGRYGIEASQLELVKK